MKTTAAPIILCALLAVACAQDEDLYEAWEPLQATTQTPSAFSPGWSLCEAVHVASGGAGIYEVLEIRRNQALDPGHVRVDLRRQEAWSTLAPEEIILRLPDAQTDPARAVALKRHEFVGLLLLPPMADNNAFAATLPPFVFRLSQASAPAAGQGALTTSAPFATGPLLEAPESVEALSARLAALEARLVRPHTSPRSWASITTQPLVPVAECESL